MGKIAVRLHNRNICQCGPSRTLSRLRCQKESYVSSGCCPALAGYLGDDVEAWKQYDATQLVSLGYSSTAPILIDVGTADPNLANQLMPEKFAEAAKKAGVQVRTRGRNLFHGGKHHLHQCIVLDCKRLPLSGYYSWPFTFSSPLTSINVERWQSCCSKVFAYELKLCDILRVWCTLR